MKVYQINVVCGNGSTGRIAADLSRAIHKNGGKCRIGYGRGDSPEDVDSFKVGNKVDLYLHALLTRITDRHGLYSRRNTQKLITDICDFGPDIIHLHNIHGYFLNYEMLFRFLYEYGKPVVWTMHDCWAFTGHCAHYESVGCNQWKRSCAHCSNLKAYPSSWNGRHVQENFFRKKKSFCSVNNLTIVTPSAWLHQQLCESFFCNYPRIIFHNGIDMKQFKPCPNDIKRQLKIGERKLILGVAGKWTRNKGLNDFITLRNMLNNEYIICLVGVSKKQSKELPPGIVGILNVKNTYELSEYYTAADVFLNLTYEDTFPTTNIEALACGTPVLTYQTGGSAESITPECGVVVNKGDLQTVVHLLYSTDWNSKSACRERAKIFQKEDCYRNYICLYQELERERY